jgi:hypothetical protein
MSEHTKEHGHHHVGRDAAGVGALGAAGLAEEHHRRNDKAQQHTSETNPTNTQSQYTQARGQHHVGRDVAGIGALGAAGLAEEHHRRNEKARQHAGGADPANTQSQYQSSQQTSQGAPLVFFPVGQQEHHGHHHGDSQNERDERSPYHSKLQKKQPTGNILTSDPSHTKQQKEHHLGRDAAIGAAAVGVGEHEHHKHEKKHKKQQEDVVDDSESPTRKKSILKRIFGSGEKDEEHHHENTTVEVGSAPHSSTQEQHPHPYGRNAAIAAGVGTAGAAGYEHHRHHQNNPVATQLASTAHAQPVQQPMAHPGTQPLNQSNITPAQTQHHPQHIGRDAAIETGVGAAGLAGYEHHKHRENRTAPTQSTYQNQGQHVQHPAQINRVPVPAQTQYAEPATASQPTYHTAQGHSGHHLGRDAALGAGAVGSAEHEHHKHGKQRDVSADNASAAPTKKEHNMLNQMFNPHSEKVNTTAILPVAPGVKSALEGIPADQKIYTDPNAKKEHNILHQIFHPNDQVNPVALGSTASTHEPQKSTVPPTAEKETGLKHQVLNRKYCFSISENGC